MFEEFKKFTMRGNAIDLAVGVIIGASFTGIVNSLAGGGTLLTFPALLSVHVTPFVANATSTVALVPGSVAGPSASGCSGRIVGATGRFAHEQHPRSDHRP